jgi:hypothetical protein
MGYQIQVYIGLVTVESIIYIEISEAILHRICSVKLKI